MLVGVECMKTRQSLRLFVIFFQKVKIRHYAQNLNRAKMIQRVLPLIFDIRFQDYKSICGFLAHFESIFISQKGLCFFDISKDSFQKQFHDNFENF